MRAPTLATAAASAAGIAALLCSSVAAACPQCAGRSDGGIAQGVVLGAFILFPFAVVAVVVRIAKKNA